ncbi:hypothetical protein [Sphingomonas sp. HMP6]|nr:hypothetical protein [Sphingomonas sp. HMP6]BCA57661.1 hypothetical protein HMP06_0430 [Sphingomonas sp. HMP6]
MTSKDQTVRSVSTAKDEWIKPEITAFAAAVEAQGIGGGVSDGSGGNVS